MTSPLETLRQQYPQLEFSILGEEATYPIWLTRVETKDPVAEWESFRRNHETTGLWPLLCSAEEPSLRNLAEQLVGFDGTRSTPEEICTQSEKFASTDDIETAIATEVEDPVVEEAVLPRPSGSPSAKAQFTLISMRSTIAKKAGLLSRLRGKAHEHLFCFVPANAPWKVFAYLNYGEWNDCPSAQIHSALHRIWHSAYGAEPVTMAFDTVECRVTRCPEQPEEALELARLHYRYCPDIVDQGVETLTALAEQLMNSRTWYFWWD